jgi:TATA-binding protein-associated factor Taf7
MLIVDDLTNTGTPRSDETIYPHGISAPLRHVRKRRFRKRISKRAIEDVEREVERLLQLDADCEEVRYGKVTSCSILFFYVNEKAHANNFKKRRLK